LDVVDCAKKSYIFFAKLFKSATVQNLEFRRRIAKKLKFDELLKCEIDNLICDDGISETTCIL